MEGTCYEHAKYQTENAAHAQTTMGRGTPYRAVVDDARETLNVENCF